MNDKCLFSALECAHRYLNLAQNLETMVTAEEALESNISFFPTRVFPQNKNIMSTMFISTILTLLGGENHNETWYVFH